MNKSVKRLSAFLAVLMMSSAFAASASAADTTFIKVKNTGAAVVNEAADTAEEIAAEETAADISVLKTSGWVKTDAGILEEDETTYVSNVKNIFVKQPVTAKTGKIYKNTKPLTIDGGKYYSRKDAEKELENYYAAHTYDFYMYEGDERIFCDGAYFVSTNNDVVYYDYEEDRLVANDAGSAYVYVYTKGGVPFFRLDVSVINKIGSTYSTLDLVPDDWHLDGAGDSTGFTIVTNGDYEAEDFKLSVVHGDEIASINKDGELKATGTGPIVVRVSLKSNANVYGEALLYAGKYVSSFYDGYYTYSGNKYVTNYWGYDYDIGDIRDYYINGWIKSQEGIFIPVLKKSKGTVVDGDTEKTTTVVSYGNVSIADLIRDAYGDKDDLYEIITKYNLFKGKDYKKEIVTSDDFDYIMYILAQMIDD